MNNYLRFGQLLIWISAIVFILATATLAAPRSLILLQPNGGSLNEPGQSIDIQWYVEGSWQSSDTVRLEYSTNSGSSWSVLPGASSLAYSNYSYIWDTTGYPDSTGYKIRVVCDRYSLSDASDTNFELRTHTIPPVITHAPVTEVGSVTGPYRINATVVDDHGISAVRIYWKKNGGDFTQAAMSPYGGDYTFTIPGPSRMGDSYCYYIEATDNAPMHNTATYPTSAPGTACCFTVTGCGTDIVGGNTVNYNTSVSSAGNMVLCQNAAILSEIQQYINVTAGADVSFYVYECTSSTGVFTQILKKTLSGAGANTQWYSSGSISVKMTAGRYYAILAGASATASFCMNSVPFSGATLFGRGESSCYVYNPLGATASMIKWSSYTINQKLNTCLVSRELALTSLNGGQLIEPGQAVAVTWTYDGMDWEPGDTIRLEYSTDSGATWMPIPGAQSLLYNSGTFSWNTTGFLDSTHYRVRAVLNGYDEINDASDADFELRTHFTPPTLTHTPLVDTGNYKGPYTISADVTDDHNVASVTLYWKRNGGAYTTITMNRNGTTNTYTASIPSPASVGDQLCYYIEAVDASLNHNVSRYPNEAPDMPVCFNILPCQTNVIVNQYGMVTPTSPATMGNIYQCTDCSELTEIEQFLSLATIGEVRFVVYESNAPNGAFLKIHETILPQQPSGQYWHSSGPISVLMVPGQSYMVAAVTNSTANYYGALSWNSQTFGSVYYGYCSNTYPPPPYVSGNQYNIISGQRLKTCRVSRLLKIYTLSRDFEPGESLGISPTALGEDWQPSDTIRFEYSTDSGATWTQIAGAEAVPYNVGVFNWNTAGCVESQHYRFKVIFNGDSEVYAATTKDLVIAVDTIAPVITHTPLLDVGGSTNRSVYATVTDNKSVGSGKLYWRKNNGAFTAITMTVSSGYCNCSLNATGVIGDVFDYYIEACDTATAGNISKSPASGYYQFGIVDSLTEAFDYVTSNDGSPFDLGFSSITFTPNGTRNFYSVCRSAITSLPTDPEGGTPIVLGDNTFAQVNLVDGATISLFGEVRSSFFVGSNGYITLDAGDTLGVQSYSNHFSRKRISGLYGDLQPNISGAISWKQTSDRVAITYMNMASIYWIDLVTFQIEMFFDGRIRLSYPGKNYVPSNGSGVLCGLSRGYAPQNYTASNLSLYPMCSVNNIEIDGDRTLKFGVIPAHEQRTKTVTLRNEGSGDVVVSSIKIVKCAEDFNDGLAQEWQGSPPSAWSVTEGLYRVIGDRLPWEVLSSYTGDNLDNFYFEVHARSIVAPNCVILRYSKGPSGGSNGYLLGHYQGALQVIKLVDGREGYYGCYGSPYSRYPDWNVLGVNAIGRSLMIYIDGRLVYTFTDNATSPWLSGKVALYGAMYGCGAVNGEFDDVIIGPPLGSSYPGFSVSDLPALPFALKSGESRDINVVFAPPDPGQYNAKIAVQSEGSDESMLSVSLTGGCANPGLLTHSKLLADEKPAGIADGCVSAVLSDRFYIQSDLLAGIGVLWSGVMPEEGSAVNVFGSMTTLGGERLIKADSVSP